MYNWVCKFRWDRLRLIRMLFFRTAKQGLVLWLRMSSSAQAAELEAIVWAYDTVAGEWWWNVVWSSDTANLIKEINSDEDPVQRSTWLGVLQIKNKCSRANWIFNWNIRTSNGVADVVATFTLSNNVCLFFLFLLCGVCSFCYFLRPCFWFERACGVILFWSFLYFIKQVSYQKNWVCKFSLSRDSNI